MNHKEFKDKYIGSKYQENNDLKYQCVALSKLYIEKVLGQRPPYFNGSPRNVWKTNNFSPEIWEKVEYRNGLVPPVGSILIWKNANKKYGHTGITDVGTDSKKIVFIEQNGGSGTATGLSDYGDQIRINTVSYSDLLGLTGWYSLKDNNNNMKIGSDHNYEEILKQEIANGYKPVFSEHKGENVLTEKEVKELIEIAVAKINRGIFTRVKDFLAKLFSK